jgi:thioredoxin 2
LNGGSDLSASEIVTCPNCGAKNRLGSAPPGQVPVCGRCKRPLPWVVEAGEGGVSPELNAPVPVLVDFWAEWCGPCRVVTPVVEELAREQAGKLKVAKVNVDRHQFVASAYQVMSIPTLMLFKDGRPVETMVGALPKQALLDKLRPHL